MPFATNQLVVSLALVVVVPGCWSREPSVPAADSEDRRLENQARVKPDERSVSIPKAPQTGATRARRAAIAYLFARQADIGGWHSDAYGQLKGGAATTALALYALGQIPAEMRPPQTKQRAGCALAFLGDGIDNTGCVANPDGSVDYPGYGSALLLLASERLELELTAERRQKLVDYLLRAQATDERGFPPENPHHGGWDLMGEAQIAGMTTGTNVSMSAFALEALRLDDSSRTVQARERAIKWLARCQNLPGDNLLGDGGFTFHPEPQADGNKAQWDDNERRRARSYGTATCDGLRALIAAGVPAEDPRVRAAVKWLVDRPRIDVVPGFEKTPPELDWQRGLHFYYLAGLAKTLPLFPPERAAERRAAMVAALVARQKPDGRWENDSSQMREDDPLIATCLALIALGTAP